MEYILTGKLSQDSGTHLETIRFYIREGLIPEPPRNQDRYKMFPPETVKRVLFIKSAREVGYSIEEIKSLLSVDSYSNEEKLQAINEQLALVKQRCYSLSQIELALRKMLQACKRSSSETHLSVTDYVFDARGSN
jgi:MerR family mercuric resistance operon transcriptional regulator